MSFFRSIRPLPVLLAWLLACAGMARAQEAPVWDLTLPADQQARSTLTVQNRCHNSHTLRVTLEELPFLELLGEPEMQVPPESSRTVPVRFNTKGMEAGAHSGRVTIICLTCASEPGCTQDREHLGVNLRVTAPPSAPAETTTGTTTREETPRRGTRPRTGGEQPETRTVAEEGPCEELRRNCEELRRIAEQKRLAAEQAEARARQARNEAEAKERAARDAEQEAREAERAAEPEPEGGWVEDTETGRRITGRDIRLRSRASQRAWKSYRNGEMSAQELEQRWEEIGSDEGLEELREQYEKELEQRQKEAEQARQKADEARQTANRARRAADQAAQQAQQARREANQAESDLAACEARLRVCERQAEEARRRREEAARRAREAEQRRIAAEQARARAAERRREHQQWLLHNIEELNLIQSPGFWETPGIYNSLPKVLQAPASYGLEDLANLPIPTDTLGALHGLYGVVGSLLDPCTGLGMRKTVERLEERVNTKTGNPYTLDEALDKTEEMCRVLRRIHAVASTAGNR